MNTPTPARPALDAMAEELEAELRCAENFTCDEVTLELADVRAIIAALRAAAEMKGALEKIEGVLALHKDRERTTKSGTKVRVSAHARYNLEIASPTVPEEGRDMSDTAERMKPEQLLSMRAFEVGDPNTWPDASTITAAVAHIDALERELADIGILEDRIQSLERELAGTRAALAPLDAIVHLLGIEDRDDDPVEVLRTLSARAEAAEARAETAWAEALEEAARLLEVRGWNGAHNSPVQMIRALRTAPPPTAKEG